MKYFIPFSVLESESQNPRIATGLLRFADQTIQARLNHEPIFETFFYVSCSIIKKEKESIKFLTFDEVFQRLINHFSQTLISIHAFGWKKYISAWMRCFLFIFTDSNTFPSEDNAVVAFLWNGTWLAKCIVVSQVRFLKNRKKKKSTMYNVFAYIYCTEYSMALRLNFNVVFYSTMI